MKFQHNASAFVLSLWGCSQIAASVLCMHVADPLHSGNLFIIWIAADKRPPCAFPLV